VVLARRMQSLDDREALLLMATRWLDIAIDQAFQSLGNAAASCTDGNPSVPYTGGMEH
jgi:hypothetical protein